MSVRARGFEKLRDILIRIVLNANQQRPEILKLVIPVFQAN